MTLLSEGQVDPLLTVSRLPEPVDEPETPNFFTETVPAAFRLENTIVSALSEGERELRGAQNPDFDPFATIIGTKYEQFADAFIDADSPGDVALVKARIDREEADRETISRAGGLGIITSMAAGFVDPINLVPVGGAAFKTALATRSILRTALASAYAGAASASIAEFSLMRSQTIREAEEAALNIAGSVILAGAMGSAIGALNRGRRSELASDTEQFLNVPPPDEPDVVSGRYLEAFDPSAPGERVDQGLTVARVADFENRWTDVPERTVISGDDIGSYWRNYLPTTGPDDIVVNPRFYLGRMLDDALVVARQFNPAFRNVRPHTFANGRMLKHLFDNKGRRKNFDKIVDDLSDVVTNPDEILPNHKGDGSLLFIKGTPDRPVSIIEVAKTNDGLDVRTIITPTTRGRSLVDQSREFMERALGAKNLPRTKVDKREATAGRDSPSEEGVLPHPVGPRGPHADADPPVGDSLTFQRSGDDVSAVEGDVKPDGPESVGAAAVARATEDELTLKGALGLEKGIAFASPRLRTATSPSLTTRRIAQELVESPFFYRNNELGVANPQAVETLAKLWTPALGKSIQNLDRMFVKYRTGRIGGRPRRTAIQTADAIGRRNTRLTYQQFREQVGMAMRRGDEHAIPEVAAVARTFRRELFEPLKDRAIEAGLLHEDVAVDTAVSYLTRVYKSDLIKAERNEFAGIIETWLGGKQSEAQARVRQADEALTELGEARRKTELELDLTREELRLTNIDVRKGKARRASGERDRIAAAAELRRSENALRKAQQRLERFRPNERLPGDDPLKEFIPELKRGGPKPPETLKAWVRSKGGLDAGTVGGDDFINATDFKPKMLPGLINNKSGRSFDDMAEDAWEEGFFPGFEERPTIDDFVLALSDDVDGFRPVIREEDFAVIDRIEFVEDTIRSLDEVGVDVRTATEVEIKAGFEALTPEDAAIRVVRDTPSNRARAREIGFNLRRAQRRHEVAKAKLAAVEGRAGDTIRKFNEARGSAFSLRESILEIEKRLSGIKRRTGVTIKKRDGEVQFAEADRVEIRQSVDDLIDQLLGGPGGRLPYDAVALVRGPLKERTFSIPDEMIERYLESDIETVGRQYINTMAPDVLITERFGRADLRDQLGQISDDYNRMIRDTESGSVRRTLQNRKQADIRDIAAMRDILRGQYGVPRDPDSAFVRVARVGRHFNFLRYMGDVFASSTPDIARPVMVNGLARTLKGFGGLVLNFRAAKLSAQEVKLAGTAWDMVLDTRARSIADIGDHYGRRTRFERGLDSASSNFSLLNLLSPWNAAMKQFAGIVTQDRILSAAIASRDGRISRGNLEKLARSGIDQDMARRIADQFETWGDTSGTVRIANTEKWDDTFAREVYRAAVVKDVDLQIVTPGAGSRPLWMSTELGKTLGQFKSFSFASAQDVLLVGLQQRDLATLNGMAIAVALGSMVYGYKTLAAGRDLSDDPAVWLAEGVDRSGVMGWLMDVNNILEKGTRGTVGINALIGGPVMSRYASRNIEGALGGPSLDLIGGIARTTGAITTGEFSRGDVRAIRRLAPYQNLAYLRALFDKVEEAAAQELRVAN